MEQVSLGGAWAPGLAALSFAAGKLFPAPSLLLAGSSRSSHVLGMAKACVVPDPGPLQGCVNPGAASTLWSRGTQDCSRPGGCSGVAGGLAEACSSLHAPAVGACRLAGMPAMLEAAGTDCRC